MAAARLKKLTTSLSLGILFAVLLISLDIMSDATQNSDRFNELYSSVLLINIIGVLLLLILIGTSLYSLIKRLRNKVVGSRLTARFVIVFVAISIVPVFIVYSFSMKMLERSIDSWFDVGIEQALNDSLTLSQASFDIHMREKMQLTQRLSEELATDTDTLAVLKLDELRASTNASELTIFDLSGHIIASSTADPIKILPSTPKDVNFSSLKEGKPYIALEPLDEENLSIRTIAGIKTVEHEQPVFLQAIYPISNQLKSQASSVEEAVAGYKTLVYLRDSLKISFALTLSMVLLLSVLAAVLVAFYSARKLLAPIENLARGTRAVAEGRFDTQLPTPKRQDELGVLVRSFNDMTERLSQANDENRKSNEKLAQQRAYLETILSSLSNGVISMDRNFVIRTVNPVASDILGVQLEQWTGKSIFTLQEDADFLAPLINTIEERSRREPNWEEQITLTGLQGTKALMTRGCTNINQAGESNGYVIVFDDITALLHAQKDAAWGEVARRLAHEIKNPLTPIQLAAERMRRKYLASMQEDEADLLDKSTHTIVQQVKALKDMVNDFSEYARGKKTELESQDLNTIIEEVIALYQSGDRRVSYRLNLSREIPPLQLDDGRIRQLIHNLVKNAAQSMERNENNSIELSTGLVQENGNHYVELNVIDNGPGFPDEIIDRAMEPYVTTKTKGTGLGLAIVKKIVEEHQAQIHLFNRENGGAQIRIRFTVA